MQTAHIRNQFYIYRRKISFSILGIFFLISQASGQSRFNEISSAGQDDKFISYGFFLAGHTNMWRMKYSEAFLDPTNAPLNNIQSIIPVYSPGFSLGFLVNIRLHDQVNIMMTPKIGFYEFKTDVNYFSEPTNNNDVPAITRRQTYLNEATMVEIPILFKYKAQRFNNTRMFFTGGGSAMFRTKDQDEADIEDLVTTGRDFTVDLGVGFDLYFKYFKFSPEVRFSHGLLDIYRPEQTNPAFRDAISEIRRKSITLYLNFQ
ncbi:type IX secretion/gliding motility protein PorT/SprT [Aquiflexum lacus]|uniref:type IX secretion/gliding motility protein PorT/SprT n=1 Tax=Aquiflexum lacus TaxID=2483805 RepID=UPI0018936770|nr:porin family protein [Aquiflexum lacus]